MKMQTQRCLGSFMLAVAAIITIWPDLLVQCSEVGYLLQKLGDVFAAAFGPGPGVGVVVEGGGHDVVLGLHAGLPTLGVVIMWHVKPGVEIHTHTDRLIMSCLTLWLEPSGLMSHDITPPHTTHQPQSHLPVTPQHTLLVSLTLSFTHSNQTKLKLNSKKNNTNQLNAPQHNTRNTHPPPKLRPNKVPLTLGSAAALIICSSTVTVSDAGCNRLELIREGSKVAISHSQRD